MRLLRSLGSRVDANSGGEIEVALRAGFAPRDIVFTGVGKTRDELEFAIAQDVGTINAESAGELDRIAAIAARRGATARVALRVNPGHRRPEPSEHLHRAEDQQVRRAARRRRAPSIASGATRGGFGSSACTSTSDRRSPPPSRCAAPPRRSSSLALELRDDGVALEHVDLGGGLGIAYEGRPMITPAEYAAAVLPELAPRGIPVVLEPGAPSSGHAGALIARVVDVKQYPGRPAVRRARRRHDRADAPGALRVVPPHRAGVAAARRGAAPGTSSARSARAATSLRATASCRRERRRPGGDARHRRLRRGDGLELQPPVCCRRKCSSTTATWTVIRRRQTLDDVLALEGSLMRGLLIAFEGLDQSGKQTQAERCATASAGRARLRADVMQLLYVANRYEWKPRSSSSSTRDHPDLRPLSRVEHRLRGGAGLDAAWLTEIQKYLPQPDITVLLDITPDVSAWRKTADRDKMSATWRCWARARQLQKWKKIAYLPGAAGGTDEPHRATGCWGGSPTGSKLPLRTQLRQYCRARSTTAPA